MTSSGPLAGIRILDLSAYIAAPYGCTLLADQGAEVIKVEPPQGDNLRKYPSTLPGEGRAFLGVNRGKSGIVLDLKLAAARDVFARLVRDADVLVHNFRPGVPERLGIGFEQMQALNERLVYCAVTGYGESGPLKDKAGYDQVLQSMAGICALQGTPESPQIVYGSVVDYYAAALLAGGVSSALYQRERTGKGQFVGVSLLRSALAMQSARFVWAADEPRGAYRDMRSGGITGLYPTREGSLYISANTPHFWTALCELIGLPQLATDPRYATVRLRAEHADELVPQVRTALAARSAPEWEQHFGERVPCAAALEIEDMFDHPQVLAERMVHEFTHPVVGRYRGLSRAVKFGDAEPQSPAPAPTFGQHTRQVLAGAGYGAEEIEALLDAGAAA
ncbi:CaiB/BaiF CoA transferase family protein [Variovorax ginsengisoli]|uniref:Formyl-CoA transferase n=1 Tax=Variovorax ginsengisoli TaxID=363844 RepID=A0ABT9SEZ4_9BURK|nr:CoA transferase [Variovorax ginsengisoli]MDP9901922.1 formyl-CoA transferase [Variovorax ginsengisoli]